MISAFRGVGKSWLTSAYVVWILLNDPDKKDHGRLGVEGPRGRLLGVL